MHTILIFNALKFYMKNNDNFYTWQSCFINNFIIIKIRKHIESLINNNIKNIWKLFSKDFAENIKIQ